MTTNRTANTTTGTWTAWTGNGWTDVPAGTIVHITDIDGDILYEIRHTAATCADVPALIGEWAEAVPGATGALAR